MKIALTYTGSEEKHGYYLRWLTAGAPVEVVRLCADENNLQQLTECDALVLSGGRDLHPQVYGNSQKNYPNAPPDFDAARDAFEQAAFHRAQELRLPVLGICRGLQLVNCIQGGTLRQDLGAALNETHRTEAGADKQHRLHIEPNTVLEKLLQTQQTWVNSAHHQAVDKLGRELRVSGTAGDGTIEGLEWAQPEGKPFLLCVQWHPERLFRFGLENSAASKTLREQFFEAIKIANENR